MMRFWKWIWPGETEYEEAARLQGYQQGFEAGRNMLAGSFRRIITAELRDQHAQELVEAERRGWLAGAAIKGDGNEDPARKEQGESPLGNAPLPSARGSSE